MKECEIAVFYNIHNKEHHWDALKSLMPALKKSGYKNLAMEMPYSYLTGEHFKALNFAAKAITSHPQVKDKFTKSLLESNDKETLSKIKAINGIKSIYSEYFQEMLHMLNNYGTVEEGQKLEIGDKVITFPITMDQMFTLNDSQTTKLIKQLKKTAIEITKQPNLSLMSSLVTLEALLNKLKLFGVDVANDEECKQQDITCRDEFMASKLTELCHTAKGKIIFSVGLSHYHIAEILGAEETIDLKQYYLTEFFESNNQDHNDALSGELPNINVIDISESDWIIGMSELLKNN